MTDETIKRAEAFLQAKNGWYERHLVETLLAFAAEEVQAERARCAKIYRDAAWITANAETFAVAIERTDNE